MISLAVAGVLSAVVMMTVVEAGGVVDGQGLASFSTLHVKLQYAVKHQPAPSVLLYIKVPRFKKQTKKKHNSLLNLGCNLCLFE